MKQEDIYYQAMLARDARFDGKFYLGVKTTGIYCRPICPAKPKRQNIEFFENALMAEEKGYRPCLRCRPELAPQSPLWLGKSAIVQRALRILNSEIPISEDLFAARFGVSGRHLRRLFVDEIGLTPKQVFDHHRLNFARQLVIETTLPMTSIAYSAQFKSLRRFNDAFKKRFERSPSQLRGSDEQKSRNEVTLFLSYRPPFDWQSILSFFRAHIISGIEVIDEESYSRSFLIGDVSGRFWVRNRPAENRLELQIEGGKPQVYFAIAKRVRKMFDLDSDPSLIADAFSRYSLLNSLWTKYPGLRIPQAWDGFESGVCAILGQLVSVEQARRLVAELLDGKEIFPTPAKLMRSRLTKVRTTLKRKQTLRDFSKLIAKGEVVLSGDQSVLEIKKRLLAVNGIGPWTCEYLALRALGDTDAFPSSDLILKRALELHPEIDINALRPWRGYAAMYLWREYASVLTKVKK